MQRDLKVFDRPGTTHTGLFAFAQDKWQVRQNVTVDLGLRWEYYTPLQGLEGAGSLSNYDPATHTLRVSGFGDTDEALNVKKKFTNFAPRTGVSWRLNEKNVLRAGYGASTIPFPDNRYAFNYPVKQTYAGTAVNGFQPAGSMATGFPAPALLDIPSSGIIPVSGSLTNATFDVIPNTLHEGTLRSWNVAYQRQLPYLLTADVAYVGNRGDDLVMDVDTNASLIYGSGNNGRPEFSTAFPRTGTQPHPHQLEQVEVQRPADEDRSPVPQRVHADELVHAEPLVRLRQRERHRLDADRLRTELGTVELRPAAQLHADRPVRAAVGAEQALAEGRARSAS